MSRIVSHPILPTTARETFEFQYSGRTVQAEAGFTIASALHRAGYPVHSLSLKNRNRSLECGIGKCGACEMLVDGVPRRVCITPVDGVREVREIPREHLPEASTFAGGPKTVHVIKTRVAIIGAGPAGLSVREVLRQHQVPCVVIDQSDTVGGQFPMQTHRFFFFEQELRFGGKRGFQISEELAGGDLEGVCLNSTVWDVLEGQRLGVKNVLTGEVFYVDAECLVVAAGAVPFMPPFKNDDLPGVYTAAVVQKMMNRELTLLGKNVLTVGAGNIGYLTSYQLVQAGACVRAIVEAMPHEGGFPVQANRVRRLGIPIFTSHMLVEAVANDAKDGIVGAVLARCEGFQPIPGTERLVEGIDTINICTGLIPDDQLLVKGKEVFGRRCWGAGDAVRIGEGTSAVMRGKQVAFEVLDDLKLRYDYDAYLRVSKEYIDSQQHPMRVLQEPEIPTLERMRRKPFVILDCLHGFACNPCVHACPHDAISKSSTSEVPRVDYEKCVGCFDCVVQCPGLAIFGFNQKRRIAFLPVEFDIQPDTEALLVDWRGAVIGEGTVVRVARKPELTHLAQVRVDRLDGKDLSDVRGFVPKGSMPDPLELFPLEARPGESESFLCHCDDVRLEDVKKVIGGRKFIAVDEIKHTTRLGMGACRGKRCIARLKTVLRTQGIQVVGEATPRAPLSNPVTMGDLSSRGQGERVVLGPGMGVPERVRVDSLVAGGGMAGSALFRYLAEAGMRPLLVNSGHGSSWRNIAGGRPAFSLPELSEIAARNLEAFEELQALEDIGFLKIDYVSFAHDERTLKALEDSMGWQEAEMVPPSGFRSAISPHFRPEGTRYLAALVTKNCWQASPGKTLDLIRTLGVRAGGQVEEDAELVDLREEDGMYVALVRRHDGSYAEYVTERFVNALGAEAEPFANRVGLQPGIYGVRHQAFITRRLPMLGVGGAPMGMLIDRRHRAGVSAVYGQQLADTGQIIGCASPLVEPAETGRNLKQNTKEFLEVVSEVFTEWIPLLASVGFQAVWSGYYAEPRMVVDPGKGLFVGLRGQGFMLSQYLAKLYVDELAGRPVPDYFRRLRLEGDGLLEVAFK